jgi:hypothetical protein
MTIEGQTYLMRYQRTRKELLKMHSAFCQKYGPMPIREWLITRGMVYTTISKKK